MILLTESRNPNFAYTLIKRNAYLRVAVLALAMQQTQANLLYFEVFEKFTSYEIFFIFVQDEWSR